MRETIVITGGAGYIGSHIGFLLAQKGYHVILLDFLLYHQNIAPFTWATVNVNDYGDAAVLDTIFTTHRVKAVIHCAGYVEIGRSVTDPHDFYENNMVKTITLLDRMRAHGVSRIVFSSSCAVYGAPQIMPISEDHPQNPISPYGNIKHMIEMILKDYDAAYGIKHIALRFFNAAGGLAEHKLCEQHEPETHIIPLIISAAITGKPFTIYGTSYPTPDGTCIRDYIHVLDIAEAHIKALNHIMGGKPSDSFNIGTGVGISVREMIYAVEQIYGVTIKINNAKPRPGDPPMLVADASRARDILQWNPRYSTLDFMIKSAHASLVQCKKHPASF